jgi:hypothetical protein
MLSIQLDTKKSKLFQKIQLGFALFLDLNFIKINGSFLDGNLRRLLFPFILPLGKIES